MENAIADQKAEETKAEETKQIVEKQSSKNSEYKRGKQSNQPKQNKFKEIVVPSEDHKTPDVPTEIPFVQVDSKRGI